MSKTAFSNGVLTSFLFAKSNIASTSLGKQLPPKPHPGTKYDSSVGTIFSLSILDVILLSEINAFRILYESTPGIFSEIFAISFEKEISMEKNALFVYFINSAD